jgi:hypothetical protein
MAKRGCKHDAERADQQRIEQADPERAAEGRSACRIVDQRLADIEAGGVVPKAEARRDVSIRQILRYVVNRGIS